MSLRSSSYDTFTLLANASPTDDMTAEEYFALIEFQEIAKKIKAEQEKLNSLVSFLQSSSSQNAPQSIKDFTQYQIDASTSIISDLSKQARELENSTVLRPLVRDLIVKAFDEDIQRVRREMQEEAKNELEEVSREWRQKRAIAVAAYQKQLRQQQNASSPAMPKPVQNTSSVSPQKQPPVQYEEGSYKYLIAFFVPVLLFFLSLFAIGMLEVPHDKKASSPPVTVSANQSVQATPTTEPALTPQAEPYTGSILGGYSDGDSEITVTASPGSSCVVRLKDTSGAEVVTFFVRAGETASIRVPDSFMYVHFATGTTWYGRSDLFGEGTYYFKDSRIVDFTEYTWSYSLSKVTDGNFNEVPIDAEDF